MARTIDTLWVTLAGICIALRLALFLLSRRSNGASEKDTAGKAAATSTRHLCLKYLPCFLCYKAADWLQGPYLYDVYMAKQTIAPDGTVSSMIPQSEIFVLMLAGFATNAIFSSFSGALTDKYGRRNGAIALGGFALGSALSVLSDSRPLMYLGRVCGGAASSLLYTAPESWLNAEAKRMNAMQGLGTVFGWAYFLDGVVAVLAGQVANVANDAWGPTGPFILSGVFSVGAAVLAVLLWRENYGVNAQDAVHKKTDGDASASGTGPNNSVMGKVQTALRLMRSDPKIQKIVVSQTAFEGAMYMFVCVWVPVLKEVFTVGNVGASSAGGGGSLPFGSIFSCFMVCCMIGSSIFSLVNVLHADARRAFLGVLFVATCALGVGGLFNDGLGSATSLVPFLPVLLSFCAFEATVGCYYPLIGTLRSGALDNTHASAIMTLARIPLNLVVIVVLCCADGLGNAGVLQCATALLALGTVHFYAF